MILPKTNSFVTTEEALELKDIHDEQEKITERISNYLQIEAPQNEEDMNYWHNTINELCDLAERFFSRQAEIVNALVERYAKSINNDFSLLIKDTQEMLDSVTDKELKGYLERRKKEYTDFTNSFITGKTPTTEQLEYQHTLKSKYMKTWQNCRTMLLITVNEQFTVAQMIATNTGTDFKEYEAQLLNLVEAKASTFCKKPKRRQTTEAITPAEQGSFLPYVYNAATDLLIRPSFRRENLKPVSKFEPNTLMYESADKNAVIISNYDEIQKNLRPSTKKLLDYLEIELAKNNTYKEKDDHKIKTGIAINIKEYAALTGKDITKKPTVDKVRRELKEDLNAIYNLSIKWQGDSLNKPLESRVIVSKGEVVKGYMLVEMYRPLAISLLQKGFISYLPKNLLAIGDKREYAYTIGRKLVRHYCFKNNIERKTNNIISVKTILAECEDSILSYEHYTSIDNRGWRRNIADKIEKVLDMLVEQKILSSWEYCNSKKKPLTEEQLANEDYNDWKNKFILFELANKEELKQLQ